RPVCNGPRSAPDGGSIRTSSRREHPMSTIVSGVFVQTNEADENRLVAFRRRPDGTLVSLGSQPTGGAGTGVPHLTSQGSVVLAGNGSALLVTNAGSDDVSVFAVASDRIELAQTVATGAAPKSVAEHGGLVYVLNTGDPSLVGFRLHGTSLVEL